MSDKKFKILIVILIVLTIFFRFWNLGDNDMTNDDALYSFRALGWFDYLSENQTAPVQWFASIPVWANLSFHDAPPLVFAVQNIFFRIFGSGVLAARLPFALAGLLTVYLIYLISCLKGKKVGLLAGAMAALMSYAVWISRIGFLEGFEVMLTALSVWLFLNYLIRQKIKYLLFWAIAAALALMSKYTAIFLAPAVVIYLFIFKRSVFLKKEFWLAVIIFILVLTPIIVYNLNVFQTRGHFDAALSSMVGMHPKDFASIASRRAGGNYWNHFIILWQILYQNISPVLFWLILISFLYLLVKVINSRANKLENFIFINLVLLFIMFLFLESGSNYLTLFIPFVVVNFSLFIFDLYVIVKNKKLWVYTLIGVLAVCFGWEIFYSFNTNILVSPVGRSPLTYSASRFYNLGFNQLDEYIKKHIYLNLPKRKRPKNLNSVIKDLNEINGQNILFFDETLNWFAYIGYVAKYQFYYRLPVISYYNIFNQATAQKTDPVVIAYQLGAKGFYYVRVIDDRLKDPVKKGTMVEEVNQNFENQIKKAGFLPEIITNLKREPVFKVYYVKFNKKPASL